MQAAENYTRPPLCVRRTGVRGILLACGSVVLFFFCRFFFRPADEKRTYKESKIRGFVSPIIKEVSCNA
jgi:hypothetical protein